MKNNLIKMVNNCTKSLRKGVFFSFSYLFERLYNKVFRFVRKKKFESYHQSSNFVESSFLKFISSKILNHKIEVILDIGSRDALQSIEFSKLFPNAKIYAFECNPNMVLKCIENSKNYENIEVVPYAVFNRNTEISFYPVKENIGASSIYRVSDLYKFSKNYSQTEISVKTIRIDTWARLHGINKIDLCWVDLQGAEYEAFESMGDLLNDIQAIYTEICYRRIYENQRLFKDVHELLKNRFLLIRNTYVSSYRWGNGIFINKKII